MNIKLSELASIARKKEKDENTRRLYEKHQMKDGKEFSYEDIIHMTAAKFACWCLEFDDLYSELTEFLLKRVREYGGWDDYADALKDPMPFTFKIIKNRAIDIYHRARRDWDRKAQLIEESFEVDDKLPHSTIGTPEEAYGRVLQSEFRDSYPVMSRPWIYVTLKLAAAGFIELSELEQYGLYIPNYGDQTNPGTQYDIKDADIIPQLGFKSTRPSSYYVMKSEIKEELLRFLDGQKMFEL